MNKKFIKILYLYSQQSKEMTLIIEGKRRSLKVNINTDTGNFLFAGVSLPENTNTFFEPILIELTSYFKNPKPKTKIEFYIEYLNTSSALFLRRIVMLAEEAHEKTELIIDWHFEGDDEDIKEFGADFKSVFKIVDINLKEIDENPYA
jgi:SiaC family regulatory phosphoprotein